MHYGPMGFWTMFPTCSQCKLMTVQNFSAFTSKRRLNRAANSIFRKLGRIAWEEVIIDLQLIKSKCIYVIAVTSSLSSLQVSRHLTSAMTSLIFRGIHRLKWRHSNQWSQNDLNVVAQHEVNTVWSQLVKICRVNSNKIESVGLRKCPYFHYLTKKVMSQ